MDIKGLIMGIEGLERHPTTLSLEYLDFYGQVLDVFNTCSVLPIAIEELKALLEQYEK
jgi:hypothetical protein